MTIAAAQSVLSDGVPPATKRCCARCLPRGIQFDFSDGWVKLPEAQHPCVPRLSDFETEIKAGHVNSTKRYYARIRLEIWQQSQSGVRQRWFHHEP
jgi:hypothetical protein